MGSIKIQRRKQIQYPDFCPICEKAGRLKRLPVGTVADTEHEIKIRIPIHAKCWAKRSTKLMLFSAAIVIVATYIWLGHFPDSGRLGGLAIIVAVFFIFYYITPCPIEITYVKEYVEFRLDNENYFKRFSKLNAGNKFNE